MKLGSLTKARKAQKNFKKKYGYTPGLYKEDSSYIIVKPYGLKKLK